MAVGMNVIIRGSVTLLSLFRCLIVFDALGGRSRAYKAYLV